MANGMHLSRRYQTDEGTNFYISFLIISINFQSNGKLRTNVSFMGFSVCLWLLSNFVNHLEISVNYAGSDCSALSLWPPSGENHLLSAAVGNTLWAVARAATGSAKLHSAHPISTASVLHAKHTVDAGEQVLGAKLLSCKILSQSITRVLE